MLVNENNLDILEKASNITSQDYEIKWFDEENGYISTDNLFTIIEDLICEVDKLEEQLEDLNNDIKDNYKPIPVSEQVGISEKDFI